MKENGTLLTHNQALTLLNRADNPLYYYGLFGD